MDSPGQRFLPPPPKKKKTENMKKTKSVCVCVFIHALWTAGEARYSLDHLEKAWAWSDQGLSQPQQKSITLVATLRT